MSANAWLMTIELFLVVFLAVPFLIWAMRASPPTNGSSDVVDNQQDPRAIHCRRIADHDFLWLARPESTDLSALSLQGHEVLILVGVGASGTDCSGRHCHDVSSDRSDIVIPRVFRDAAIISVVRTTPVFAAQRIHVQPCLWPSCGWPAHIASAAFAGGRPPWRSQLCMA